MRYNTRLREQSLKRRKNVDLILVEEIDLDDEWITEKEESLLSHDAIWLEDDEVFNVDAIRIVSSKGEEIQAPSICIWFFKHQKKI